jgi:hypothetical protein
VDVLVSALQVASGGIGLTMIIIVFSMWRSGDLVPKAVVEMLGERYKTADDLREAARRVEAEQNRQLMTELMAALQAQQGRSRHGRDY